VNGTAFPVCEWNSISNADQMVGTDGAGQAEKRIGRDMDVSSPANPLQRAAIVVDIYVDECVF
jgi:hypothetical protein